MISIIIGISLFIYSSHNTIVPGIYKVVHCCIVNVVLCNDDCYFKLFNFYSHLNDDPNALFRICPKQAHSITEPLLKSYREKYFGSFLKIDGNHLDCLMKTSSCHWITREAIQGKLYAQQKTNQKMFQVRTILFQFCGTFIRCFLFVLYVSPFFIYELTGAK